MAKQKGADQTERPTPKRLRDARKDGEIHKSRELTRTALLLVWLLIGWLFAPFFYRRLTALFDLSLDLVSEPFAVALPTLMAMAAELLLIMTVPFLLAALVVGVFVEYLQVGAIFAPVRVKPKAEHLNPVSGIKRMFSLRNLVELAKSIVKAAALVLLLVLVVRSLLPDLVGLSQQPPEALGKAYWIGTVRICIWVIFVFFFVSALDALYQRFEYIKNLKMSRRDIRQEVKENEGDPLVKNQRKQLHQEWAQQNMLGSVRQSSVVVTNPTHVAVALLYEEGETDLPVVVAKGEDYEAQLIREAAEEANVPILQNVELARGLNENVELDQYISEEFFVAVAEVLKWAQTVKEQL